jgi:hypothetical protein
LREVRNEHHLERSNRHHALLIRYRLVRCCRSHEGVGAVISYRDYLDLKKIRPIVIERTTKRKGDKVITSSYKKAEVVK